MNTERIVTENLRKVRARMARATQRAGRSADAVELVAVTKNRPIEAIQALLTAGHSVFGENRIQEALPKIVALGQTPTWRLIGHLQRNKTKAALSHFHHIDSVDSERLLREIDRQAAALGKTACCSIQVNTAAEEQKYGCSPDQALELFRLGGQLPHVQLEGLMAMAPLARDPEEARPAFRALRELSGRLAETGIEPERLRHLSMGMSNDFEVAIEEGSTMVRVGSALFQGLP